MVFRADVCGRIDAQARESLKEKKSKRGLMIICSDDGNDIYIDFL